MYHRDRRRFWSEVIADPPLNIRVEVSGTEIRVSLDHIVEKAIGENWRRALDPDNLRMEFAMPNTYREIIQARHLELRLLGAQP